MNTVEFIQGLALSGALGYLSLSWLQNHGAVTKYLTKEESRFKMVTFGVIDYLIYVAAATLLQTFHIGSTWITVISVAIAAIITVIYTKFYSLFLMKHYTNKKSFHSMTTRESAFDNPYKGNVQVDVFSMDGKYMTSGLVHLVDLQNELSNDVSLLALPEGYEANKDKLSAATKSNLSYFDMKNGIVYFITYFSKG